MATYEEIYGKRVDVFDSDPTLNSSYEGQVWYDSATGNLKSVVTFSAWVSSTGPTAQLVSLASGGTQRQTTEEFTGETTALNVKTLTQS